jgi:hypothetical protein
VKYTPVIVVVDTNFAQFKNLIKKAGVTVNILAEEDRATVDSLILNFAIKVDDLF